MKNSPLTNIRDLRRKLGLNQSDFWSPLGVSQSCGSRYESDRAMPRPVRMLFDLVHVRRVDIGILKGEDYAVVEYLKKHQPELFRDLKKQAKSRKQA